MPLKKQEREAYNPQQLQSNISSLYPQFFYLKTTCESVLIVQHKQKHQKNPFQGTQFPDSLSLSSALYFPTLYWVVLLNLSNIFIFYFPHFTHYLDFVQGEPAYKNPAPFILYLQLALSLSLPKCHLLYDRVAGNDGTL